MFRSGLDCVSLSEGTYSGFLICSDLRKWQIQIKETKRATFSPILLMEEILHHLGLKATVWIKGKPPINWCRISSININSMVEWNKSQAFVQWTIFQENAENTQTTQEQPESVTLPPPGGNAFQSLPYLHHHLLPFRWWEGLLSTCFGDQHQTSPTWRQKSKSPKWQT